MNNKTLPVVALFLLLLYWFSARLGRYQDEEERAGRASSRPTANANTPPSIPTERYEAIRQIYAKVGGRVEVENGGKVVKIYLPVGMAIEMDEHKAKIVAAETQARIGKVSVFIKAPSGRTIASVH